MKARTLPVAALVVLGMLALAGCNSEDDCESNTYRCDANVQQMCGATGDWIDWKDCVVDEKVCQDGLCKTCQQVSSETPSFCPETATCVGSCAEGCSSLPYTCASDTNSFCVEICDDQHCAVGGAITCE